MIYFGEVLVDRRFCDAIKKLLLLTSYFTKRRIMLKNRYCGGIYWALKGYYLSTKSLSPSDGIFTKALSVKITF